MGKIALIIKKLIHFKKIKMKINRKNVKAELAFTQLTLFLSNSTSPLFYLVN